jgi:hypothetical protein
VPLAQRAIVRHLSTIITIVIIIGPSASWRPSSSSPSPRGLLPQRAAPFCFRVFLVVRGAHGAALSAAGIGASSFREFVFLRGVVRLGPMTPLCCWLSGQVCPCTLIVRFGLVSYCFFGPRPVYSVITGVLGGRIGVAVRTEGPGGEEAGL